MDGETTTKVLWTCAMSGFSRRSRARNSRRVGSDHTVRRARHARQCGWIFGNFAVIALVDEYLVSCLRQHLALLLEHGVFPTRLLVGVVHQENFHRGMTRPGPAPQERSGGKWDSICDAKAHILRCQGRLACPSCVPSRWHVACRCWRERCFYCTVDRPGDPGKIPIRSENYSPQLARESV